MKELPYFKFFPNQWITGSISFMDLELQGAFIKTCCFYWSKECNVPREQLKTIIPRHYVSLLNSKLLKIVDDKICIKWLDEQYNEFKKRSKVNAANGRKGGLTKANGKDSLSIEKREDKKRKDKYQNDNLLKLQPEVLKILNNAK
tara:strand:- start:3259 stop:3693 length:435 start_codon:yes stop_codon:yes gene_type:complete